MTKSNFWQPYYQRWLNRRIPQTKKITLGHRSIFIIPTKAGGLYLVLLVLMLVTAINYQNNLLFGLTFWLFSLALVAMILTFRNLAGLTISTGKALPCFVNEKTALPLFFETKNSKYQGISFGFAKDTTTKFDGNNETINTFLYYHAQQRGYLDIQRVRVETSFPLGLFTAWSWLKLDFTALAYPEPEFTPFVFTTDKGTEQAEHAQAFIKGDQDFHGLRDYQPGDTMRQISWKHVAKGKGIVSKEFEQPQANCSLFGWDSLAPLPQETRLSRLCGWIINAHEQGRQYGLELPQQSIPLDYGEQHKQRCLTALALYNLQGGSSER